MTLIAFTYLVSLMSGSSGDLALLARCKLRKVTVVVALPFTRSRLAYDPVTFGKYKCVTAATSDLHFMVENLRLARLSLGDQRLIEDVKNILANLLEFGLNLLTVLADGGYVLVGAFRFLLLLDGGDDAPRSTSGTYDVLVGHREKVALIDSQFSPKL
jgi:hypothetical protein